jgi:hypothetical protein
MTLAHAATTDDALVRQPEAGASAMRSAAMAEDGDNRRGDVGREDNHA